MKLMRRLLELFPFFSFFYILFLYFQPSFAQNLVLNPSFENTTATGCGGLTGSVSFNQLINWDNANSNTPGDSCSSPDLFSPCNDFPPSLNPFFAPSTFFGEMCAHSGTQFAGIITSDNMGNVFGASNSYREYIQGKLSSPLVAGQTYCVSFYISLGSVTNYMTNHIGVYFSNTHYLRDACVQGSLINETPQLDYDCGLISQTQQWVRMQWNYVATGGEQYFIIGNFYDDPNTQVVSTGVSSINPYAYYFIDDVSVEPGTCCSAEILPPNSTSCQTASNSGSPTLNFCVNDSPTNLDVETGLNCSSTTTGTWSGTGITDATAGTFSPSVAGVGTFTITYTSSCGATATATVQVSTCDPLTLCQETNGDLTVSGGTAPYSWQSQTTTQDCSACLFGCTVPPGCAQNVTTWTTYATGATVAAPGVFPVQVVDNSGTTLNIPNLTGISACSATPPCPTITMSTTSQTNVKCKGGNDGSATIQASGGASPYTFTWNPGNLSGATQNGLSAGSYTISITDNNGCTGSGTVTITEPATALSASTTVTQDADCGQNNGAVGATVSGGTSPYSFSWSDGSTNQNLTNVGAGSYTLTVTDANNCTATSTSTVAANGSTLSITSTDVTQPSCNGVCDGQITVNVSGGNPPYTYQWYDENHNPIGTNSATITDLCAGNYSVEVSSTSSGGSTTTIFSEDFNSGATTWTLNVPMATEGADPNFFKVSDEEGGVAPNGCGVAGNGDPTLFITSVFNPTGGAAYDAGGLCGILYCPETHRQAESPTINTTGQTGLTLSFDFIANGDIPNDQATVWYDSGSGWTQLGGALSSGVCGGGQGMWTAYSQALPASCENNPNLKIAIRWDNNDDGVGTDPSVAINNLKITTTGGGASACSVTGTATLTDPPVLTVTVEGTTSATCGNTNGGVDVTISGGTSPYNYSWSNGATTEDLTNVGAGSYTLTVTDAHNCTQTASATVTSTSGLSVTATVDQNATCGQNNGAVSSAVTGGTAPYIYSWSNGATTQNITNVGAGSYTVTVTDNAGCSATSNANVTSSSSVTVTTTVTQDADCGQNNGAVSATVSGGTSPYSFSWSDGSTNQNLTNVGAGSYTLTVTDANNCTATSTSTVAANGSTLSITSTDVTQPSCNGVCDGQITVNVSGGNPPYTYQWYDENHNPIGTNSATITDLCAGNYSVEVSSTSSGGSTTTIFSEDFNSGATTWTLNVPMATEGADPNFFKVSDEEGGVAPNGCGVAGNGDPTLFITSVFNPTGGAAYDAGGLCGILYCPETHRQAESPTINTTGQTGLTLSFDFIANGDIPNDQATVWYDSGSGWTQLGGALSSGVCGGGQGMWTAYSQALPASCENNPNLKIAIRWDNNDDGVGTDPSVAINNLKITTTGGGASACSVTGTATLTDPPVLTVTVEGTTSATCGNTNGGVDVTISGGTSPYNYSWSNGATTEDLTNVGAGSYTLTVTDAHNCTQTASATVTSTSGLSVTATVDQNATCGQNNGAVSSAVTGGTAPYIYSWSNGATTQNITNVGAGSYTVTVTDNAGCSATSNAVQVTNSSTFTVTGQITQPTCQNPQGSITLTMTGGTSPYSFVWNNGGTTNPLTNLAAGSYSVTVTDANGCQATQSFTLSPADGFDAVVHTQPAHCGIKDGSAQVEITQGTGPFTYSFSPGNSTSNPADSLTPGNYSVTITNGQGCTITKNFVIDQNDTILSSITANPLIIHQGESSEIEVTTVPGNLLTSYSWNPSSSLSCNDCPNPIASPNQDTWYYVYLSTPDGCIGKDSILIRVKKNCGEVFIPSIFSPNEDGNNDYFTALGNCIVKGEIFIYNRWGNLVYHTEDITAGWDGTQRGKDMNTGVYTYRIEVTTDDEETYEFKGNVTLVR